MHRFFSRVSLGLSLIYIIPLVGFVLLRGLPSHAPWWLDLANAFTLYLFIPTVLVLLLGLLSFSMAILKACLLPIVLFVLLYGGLFLPTFAMPTSASSTDTITVMTHNVGVGNGSYAGVIQAVIGADPDIVAIQELTPRSAEALTAGLGSRYRYRVLLPKVDYSGAGIFSRFPIEMEEFFSAGHMAQHVVLDVHGQRVHLFNLHPYAPEISWMRRRSFPPYLIRGFDTERQWQDVETIMKKVDEAGGPLLVVGDFNMTDQSRQYGRVTRNLTDVYREVGWGFGHTFPADIRVPQLPLPVSPVIRIDYIFHSRELAGLEARVGDHTGSDHLPVIARLSLRQPSIPQPSNTP